MVFPVVMYGCESWAIRKWSAEELMLLNCGVGEDSWGSLGLQGLRLTANQSILKEISPEYSLEGLMLKLKLQYFGHLMQRTDSFFRKKPWCWERLKTGREGSNRGRVGWMPPPTPRTWVWASSGVGDRQGSLVCCSPWGQQRIRHNWVNDLN